MKREEVLDTLRRNKSELQRLGVAHAALFGSHARNENRPDSDIDLMVQIDPAAKIGVYEYVGIIHYLQSLFSEKVDIANRDKLKPLVRPNAERDAINAF